ncbi:unnamed protein product [Bursaphelenchus okinawaensis]|uniref:N-acetyllactosaminide beta-1,3-N-acetylglucosaminyltransferase n=1 Tax=Bursaphelenchus okinawaensis TaxID=465554 RepID=A0A811L7H9_9BILA|nr:unnamed protein product [Bursaphelenchus okinawaensis]CAG9118391.1 unnamed protein product [Bursaphelenchus okinawaensis]
MLRIKFSHVVLLGLNCILALLFLSQFSVKPVFNAIREQSNDLLMNFNQENYQNKAEIESQNPQSHQVNPAISQNYNNLGNNVKQEGHKEQQDNPEKLQGSEIQPANQINHKEDLGRVQHQQKADLNTLVHHLSEQFKAYQNSKNNSISAKKPSDIVIPVHLPNQSQPLSALTQPKIANLPNQPVDIPKQEKTSAGFDKNKRTLKSHNYKGGYCVMFDHWKADPKYNQSITYVIHASMPFMHYIEPLAEVWDGPISVGVYVPAPDFQYEAGAAQNYGFMESLAKLETFKAAKASGKVSIHLLFDEPERGCEYFVYNESQLTTDYEYLKHMYDHASHIPNYPCQQLRNLARIAMKTRLFVASDIENIPNERYVERMLPLAQKLLIEEARPMVLVHRRFEVSEVVPLPKTKTELKALYDQQKAVEFHKIFYAAGHSIPYLDEWFNVPEDPKKASVFKTVPYTNGQWEPQFVADSYSIPLHDETFPYPHRGHTELGYEVCRAGFEFAVVNDMFTMHKGIKTKASKGETQGVEEARNNYNTVVYNYKKRIDYTYWQTRGKCGTFRP